MRALAVVLLGLLVLAAVPPVSRGGELPAEAPYAAIDQPDVPTYIPGTWWTTDLRLSQWDSGGNSTNAHSILTTTVVALETVVQNGRTYWVYNSTLSGSIWANGTVNVGGTPLDVRDLTGTVSGYSWVDRGDLSVVRNNQTSSMAGTVDILGGRPITLDAFATTFHDPAREEVDFPLVPPESWSIALGSRTVGEVAYFVDMPIPLPDQSGSFPIDEPDSGTSTAWVNGTEFVTVPAGTLDTFRLEYEEGGAMSGTQDVRWWAPDAKTFAKLELHESSPTLQVDMWDNLTAYFLAPPPETATMAVSPNPASTCGIVTVTGAATVPSSPGTLWVGAVETPVAANTDAVGAYSTSFSLPPTLPDFTPTTTDYASHGLVLEIGSAPNLATNVSTLTILRPDVGLIATDITATSPVFVGQNVDLTATVHEATGAPYGCPFSVLIEVDGATVVNVTVPSIAALGTALAAGTWLASTPGWHTTNVTVWPLYLESLTGNNTASLAFFVDGPDLSITDILVHTSSFGDTTSAGGRSGSIPVNLGFPLPVSFNVTNVGGMTASASRVVAYNTSFEGGPPTAPPFYDVPAPTLSSGEAAASAFAWTAPATPGTYHFTIEVDADGALVEADESNNTFYVSVATDGPDLTPSSVSVTTLAGTVIYSDPFALGFQSPPITVWIGSPIQIGLNVSNVGNVAANESYSVALVNTSGPGGPALGSPVFTATEPAPHPVLEVRSRAGVAWPAPRLPGVYYVNVTVDYGGDVVEISDANNTFVLAFNLTGPDLAPTDLAPPAVVTEGATVFVQANVTNAGAYEISGPPVEYSWTLDGAPAGSGEFPSPWMPYLFPPGARQPVGYLWNAPVVGNHTLCLVADPNDVFLEIDEGNNALCAVVRVAPPPSTTIGFLGPHLVAGGSVRIAPVTPIVLNATDYGGAGIAAARYAVDGDPLQPYAAPFRLASEGAHTVTFYSEDNLGGVEPLNSATVFVDATGPDINVTPTREPGRTLLDILVTDPAGVAGFEYRIGNGSWVSISQATFLLELSEIGTTNLTLRATDALGNVAVFGPAPYTVDPVPPPDGLGGSAGLPGWLWVLLAAAVILFLIFLLAWRRRRKKPDEATRAAASGAPPEPVPDASGAPPTENPSAEPGESISNP